MTRTTATTLAAALLLGAPLLTACGAGEDEAKARAEEGLHALGGYDGAKYCSLKLTKDNSKPLTEDKEALQACVDGVAIVASQDTERKMAELKKAKVTKADVGGDMAAVDIADIEGLSDTTKSFLQGSDKQAQIKLKKIDGQWYLFNQEESSTP